MNVDQITRAATVTLGILCLVSCGTVVAPFSAPGSSSADVYVAGYETNGNTEVAKYWKNGQAVALTDGTYGAYATAIAGSGDDVYVVGNEGSASGNDVAMYWRDGVATALTDGTREGYATSIFLSANDVYVAGSEVGLDSSGNSYTLIEYWKNGVPVILSDSSAGGTALSIFVSGTDVYVAGFLYETTQTGPSSFNTQPVATYWKNGVAVGLTDGSYAAVAFSIFVSSGDVYVSGYNCLTLNSGCEFGAYWKNGALVQLTSTDQSTADSIFVSGSDVYVADNVSLASGQDEAALWKDGTETVLFEYGITAANQVVVFGSDVYVAGAAPLVGYWKNGNFVSLSDCTCRSTAFGIAVVQN